MAIEQFTTAEFEAALPVGAWKALGMVQGEQCYLVTPSDAPAGYGVLVRSSIGLSGIADDCGEDSIRCILCKRDGDKITPIGNKARRWTTRVKGWQSRMMELLKHCKAQLSRVRPCPSCGVVVVPFTSHKKESKGRAFVSCMNKPDCGKFFEWCDEAPKEAPPIKPQAPAQEASGKTPTVVSPICPKCSAAMVRMSSGKGYRCACPGNEWLGGKWTKCDGVIWDNVRTPAQAPALSATENNLLQSIRQAARLLGGNTDKEKTAIALVALLDGDQAATLADFLINVGNLQAERASVKVKG